MSSIEASERLASLLRSQVAAFRRNASTRRATTTRSSQSGEAPDVAAIVARRIRALASDDLDRERKAVRIFLESILLQHFGADLIHDASFAEMVDAVHGQIESDQEMGAAAEQLGALLLAGETKS